MAMTNQKGMISSEEARIMLLEQKNDDFHQALMRIEKRFDSLENKIELLDQKVESKIDLMDKKFESKLDLMDKKFESKFDYIDKKFESKFDKMNDKIDSHFRWTISLIFGLYATAFATLLGAVGKAYHWF